MKHILFILFVAFFLGGCASIPPEALAHASALKDFHEKSSSATLAAYNSSISTIKYTVEAWKDSDSEYGLAYVDACHEASDVFANSQRSLGELSELFAELPAADTTRQAAIHQKISDKIKDLRDELAKRQASFDTVTVEMRKRNKDHGSLFNEHLKDLDLASDKLKGLMSSNSDIIDQELARQEALLSSYLSAQSKIKQVFGPQLSSKAVFVTNEGINISNKYAPYVSAIEATIKN